MDENPQRLVAWLGSHPGVWSSAELARALGVTDRTIRNYIARANASFGGDIIERAHKGYRLRGVSTTSHSDPLPPVPARGATARRDYSVLRTLMTSPKPVTIYDLANQLDVSESTIDNTIRRLAGLSARMDVVILRSGDEITVRGSEADRRRVMRQALVDAADPATLLATSRLEAAYESYDIRELQRHVTRSLAEHGLHSNDYALNPLVLDLVIAVDRITDDFMLDPGRIDDAILDDPRLMGAAGEITRYLTDTYGIAFTPIEVESVAMLLASKTTLLRGATDDDLIIDHVGPELVALVRRILTKLDEIYLVDIADDAFSASLSLHTYNMLLRARARRPQRNPLATATRNGHPLVHELAVFFASELERATGLSIDGDEIGFIAFHIGAALSRHRDTSGRVALTLVAPGFNQLASRIADRLTTALGDLAEVTQVIETAEPHASDVTGELVVSPIPVPGLHPARLVLISPMLSDSDLEVIDTRVRSQRRSNSWMQLVGQLHDLFHDRLFYRSPRVSDRDEVLRLLCGALQRHRAVPEDFLEQVHERERLSPTAFNDVVAIPHTLGMPAQRTSIAVATFGRPIDWAGTPVRLVLLVAFSAKDRHLFRDTFDQLVIALSEPANVHRLVERGFGLDEFLAELSRLMQDE